MNIWYKTFANKDEYNGWRRPKSAVGEDIDISMADYMRAVYNVCIFNSHVPTRAEMDFYKALANMALNFDGTDVKQTGEYKDAEDSIKAAVSFFLGMIFTQIIANKVYKIKRLYHLKDNRFIVDPKESIPDYFGTTNKKGKKGVYLFEAKGTSKGKVDYKRVEEGRNQLENVNSVAITRLSGVIEPYTDFERNVIALGFDHDDKVLICDIDPNESDGNVELEFDEARNTCIYYDCIYRFLASQNIDKDPKVHVLEDMKYIGINQHGVFFGMQEDIYTTIKEMDSSSDTQKMVANEIDELLPGKEELLEINKKILGNGVVGDDGIVLLFEEQ